MQNDPEDTKNVDAHNMSDQSQQDRVTELNQSGQHPAQQE